MRYLRDTQEDLGFRNEFWGIHKNRKSLAWRRPLTPLEGSDPSTGECKGLE